MDVSLAQLYGALVLAGIVLITLEVFVPGGILGGIGAIALVSAAGVALRAFPGFFGWLASAGSVVVTVTAIILWFRFFSRTRLGKALTVSTDLQSAQAGAADLGKLINQTGQAVSILRPGGYALLEGRRIDVVTRGESIPAGTPVRVIFVEGNRVIVEALENTPG